MKITWDLLYYIEKILKDKFNELDKKWEDSRLSLHDEIDRNYIISMVISELVNHMDEEIGGKE